MAQTKRLVLCCDGTWNDSVSTNNPLTNVARFSRIVEERAADGVLQIVYYHTGVGAGTSRISNSIDGAVGRGLGANVRNAYNFLCQNFNHKDLNDEIYLLGFSRGAFTVRCVASLVDSIGILTKPGLSRLYEAYGLWKTQAQDGGHALTYFVEQLRKQGLVRVGVKIKACGVWDTVSAIGVQLPAWLPQPPTNRLAHVDTRIPACVENAFHAMALNERRSAFWPVPWSEPHDGVKLRQTWFLGAHADVGGGYQDAGLANVALVWMVAQFQHCTPLEFDLTYLLSFLVTKEVDNTKREHGISIGAPGLHHEIKRVIETKTNKGEAGKIANSFTLFWHAFGQRPRKPGLSYLTNKVQHSIGPSGAQDDLGLTSSSTPQVGLNAGVAVHSIHAESDPEPAPHVPTSKPPQATCDTIHFTVRVLLASQHHSCHLLDKFRTTRCPSHPPKVRWERHATNRKGKSPGTNLSIDEAAVTPEEMALLRLWLTAAGAHGLLESVSDTTSVSLTLGRGTVGYRREAAAANELWVAVPDAETARTMVDAGGKGALWLLLYAYLGEGVEPSLMFGSRDADG